MKAWEEFLRKKEQELGAETVRKWLKPLKVVHFDAGNLYLESSDHFLVPWFEEQIRPNLSKELRNSNGRSIVVHLSGPQTAKMKKIWKPTFDLSPDSLDPFATFSNFVGGREIVELLQNSSAFNPIYLHGPPGSGKTHLLMALAHFLPNSFFIRAETFTQHFVAAIRNGAMEKFRSFYRSKAALLIDDIDVFAGRSATQEEFFHTFNTLHKIGRPMIFTAYCPPGKLTEIEPRLTSRFEWGLVLPLEKSISNDLLLEMRAKALDFPLSEEVKKFLLQHFTSHPKALLRSLEALVLRCHLDQIPPDRINPAVILAKLIEEEKRVRLTPEKVVQHVAMTLGMKASDILGKSQTKECSWARKVAMALCRKNLKMSYPKIGQFFSRDHSTVMSSVKAIKEDELQIFMKGWPGLLCGG